MCLARLGLKAPALAWLYPALAYQKPEPGQSQKIRLGLAWLWPKPGLRCNMGHTMGDFVSLCSITFRSKKVTILDYNLIHVATVKK